MNEQEIFEIYKSQSENVRHLKRALKGLQKDINHYFKKSDDFQVNIKTKILSLVYSAWSEAQFIQIIYTPNGFMSTEIETIKREKERNGIAQAWRYMITKALEKVGDPKLNSDLNARLTKLLSFVARYIEEPSVLRNKIAHGQWVNALNRENTAVNTELTLELNTLDPVDIAKRIEIHQYLGYIVRDLVQSPRAGFHNHYWTNIVNLEAYLERTRNWSLERKRAELSKRPF